MKKLQFVLVVVIVFLSGFSYGVYEAKKQTAEAKQNGGLYIFFASEPVLETEYLGTVRSGSPMDGYFSSRLEILIKKAKKDFPEAEALIFKKDGVSSAEVVKYK